MKITGPGSGSPPDGVQPPDEAQAPSGAKFAEKIDKAAVSQQPRAGDVEPAAGGIADIGADLRAGRITPAAAIERVVERVLDRQVGADAPAAVRAKIEASLRQALEDDPLLAAKIRSLSG